jgi:hypothetical protein
VEQSWDGAPEDQPDEFEDTFEERAGWSLASGDFNDDGFEDLAIGVPGESSATQENCIECGAVNVLYGSTSGLGESTSQENQFWHPEVQGLSGPTGFFFGWSVTSGDFNNDGFEDLAIGVPDYDGIAWLILGAPIKFTGRPVVESESPKH